MIKYKYNIIFIISLLTYKHTNSKNINILPIGFFNNKDFILLIVSFFIFDFTTKSNGIIVNTITQNKIVPNTGVSVYTKEDIELVLESEFIPDVIQLPINILDNSFYKNGTLKDLHTKGIEIHARSIFLQGLFYLKDN